MWEIWGPNGGYLAALALRAAGMAAEIERPASFYCQFLRSPEFERAELEVDFLKRSRRSEALAVQMTQAGRPVLQALVRTAADAPGYEQQHLKAPSVPSHEGLLNIEQLFPEHERPPFRFWENIERRPVEQERVREHGPAVLHEWTRFRPCARFADPFVDAARPLILLDTYGWPAVHRAHRGGRYIAPNIDTSVWFHHASPYPEWLLVEHSCVIAGEGLLGVSGRVWDAEGRLLASGGAQLYCVPAPPR